ncbi:GATA transcription factor 16-like [Malania oleifera]|uniref:GATA transcription factor 16-like n=1 Tax=Malania oleifera TaxID=397392 RepID=UPI0025ADFE74|nr:GATA transcription factor 16-like [Malania oleifera]XP_057963399.1 GATA transcription factor 16-like [Malania oleifera]
MCDLSCNNFGRAMGVSQKESLSVDGKEREKCCADCKTTKTPLWRGGPAGPKSLCNACGIRYRKRRSSMVGLNKGTEKKKERSPANTTASAAAAVSGEENGLSESLKMRLMALGNEMLMQRSSFSSPVKRQRSRRKLREEERAAVVLMALSCGSVFA